MSLAIKVDQLSKAYQLGEIGTGTISRDIERWIARKRGKEDPFLRVGETNDRTTTGNSNIVWSLKDISFEIEKGSAVGVIGRNGAGKSTLLKLLSRVTSPTTGTIRAKGRIASLLEVGTGFHPDLTGKENIYLNGAILGMRKKEIDRKLDEIVDFSGVERYVDTPVKRYSSGMYVRLAFAVAANLESEVLIVDEVLAVGDAEFQKKCLGKMSEVSRGEGKTVIFVSHNMMAIKNLCTRALYLKNGMLVYNDAVEKTITRYLEESVPNNSNDSIGAVIKSLPADEAFELLDFKLKQNGAVKSEFVTNQDVAVEYSYRIKQRTEGLRIGFDLLDMETDSVIFRAFHDDHYTAARPFEKGTYTTTFILPADFLKDKNYILSVSIGVHNKRWIVYDNLKMEIKLYNIDGSNKIYADQRPGLIMPLINSDTKPLHV